MTGDSHDCPSPGSLAVVGCAMVETLFSGTNRGAGFVRRVQQALARPGHTGVGVVCANLRSMAGAGGPPDEAMAVAAVERVRTQLPAYGACDVDGARIRLLVHGSVPSIVAAAEAVQRCLAPPDGEPAALGLGVSFAVAAPGDDARRLLQRAEAALAPATWQRETLDVRGRNAS